MKKKKLSALLAFLLLLSAFAYGCGSSSDEGSGDEASSNQELRVLTSSEIPTMDSVMATDATSFTMLSNVNEGLYALDQDNNLVPAVADGEPEVNAEGTEFTVTLKEDAVWSNGDQVTAHDFVYAWQKAIDPETASTYGPYMMGGKIAGAKEITEAASAGETYDVTTLGVEALDNQTLVVKTAAVMTVDFFKGLMAFGTFLPQNQAFVEEQGENYATSADTLLSNGPFKMASWSGTTATEWTVEKNEDYYDADSVSLTKITFNVSKDSQSAVNAFESGEVDITSKLSSDIVPQYEDDERLVSWLDPRLSWLKLNEDNEYLANENIRRAIAIAFNKDDLVADVLNNGSVAANYVVPADFVKDEDGNDFRDANGDLLTYDAEAAKQYWEQGLQELGVTEITLSLLGSDTDEAKKVDQYLKAQLETNLEGLTIEITDVPFAIRIDREITQDYDIVNSGWAPDYLDPISFSDLWVTGGENNNMSYSNPAYDELIAKAEQTTDTAEKWSYLQEAERIVLEEDAAVAPIYQQSYNILVADYVEGFTHHSVGTEYSYKYISINK